MDAEASRESGKQARRSSVFGSLATLSTNSWGVDADADDNANNADANANADVNADADTDANAAVMLLAVMLLTVCYLL